MYDAVICLKSGSYANRQSIMILKVIIYYALYRFGLNYQKTLVYTDESLLLTR